MQQLPNCLTSHASSCPSELVEDNSRGQGRFELIRFELGSKWLRGRTDSNHFEPIGLDLNFRARPPGLIQHVLTVLVFCSWVLLLPRLPPSSRSLRLFPWASILLHGPLGICLDLLPAAPLPPVQKQDAQYMLLQHRGTCRELIGPPPPKVLQISKRTSGRD